jgi:hypothetical protein
MNKGWIFLLCAFLFGVPAIIFFIRDMYVQFLTASFFLILSTLVLVQRFIKNKEAQYPLKIELNQEDYYFPKSNIPRPIIHDEIDLDEDEVENNL